MSRPRFTEAEDNTILMAFVNLPPNLGEMEAARRIKERIGSPRSALSIYQRFRVYLAGPMRGTRMSDMTDLQKLFVCHYNNNFVPVGYRMRLEENLRLIVENPISDDDYIQAMNFARQAQQENEAAVQPMAEDMDQ